MPAVCNVLLQGNGQEKRSLYLRGSAGETLLVGGNEVIQDFFKFLRVVLSVEGEARQGNQRFSQQARIQPAITCHDALDTAIFADEGIGLTDQLVVEGIDGADFVHHGGEAALEAGGIHRLSGSGAHHQGVSAVEVYLEGAGDQKIFPAVEAAAHLVRIGNALVPDRVGLERRGRCAQLQVQFRKVFVEAESGTVLDGFEIRFGGGVFSRQAMHVAEGQERL